MKAWRKDNRGVTLTEMVITMVVLSVTLLVLTALTSLSLRVYEKGANITYAFVDANRALEWVCKDIRKSILAEISYAGTRLTLTMPQVDPQTGTLVQPLTSDGQPVVYYLGTANGSPSVYGTYLWRLHTGSGQRSLISEVAGAKFEWATNGMGPTMKLIQITLTATRGGGANVQSRTIVSRASVRN